MHDNRISRDFVEKLDALGKIPEGETLLPPWLFRHEDLLQSLESARVLDQKYLINAINYIHFSDSHIFVFLEHSLYKKGILLKARPEPCVGEEVICHWLAGNASRLKLENFKLQYLIIADGQSIILMPARLKNTDDDGITIELQNVGYAIGHRKARRHLCHGVIAELHQNGFIARGSLTDFNTLGFRITVSPVCSSFLNWFNPDQQIMINLSRDQQIIFSGSCSIIRQTGDGEAREIVLAPLNDTINRFRKKQFRSQRRQIVPTPAIIFEHPLFKKKVQREVKDIANMGFSVIEEIHDAVLLPGMIIPNLAITFHGLSPINCLCQVIYRQEKHEEGVLCGIAILDMDIESHSHLTQIISSLMDHHTHLSQEIDTDELWKFFFESGFIYPQKYNNIHAYRHDFKEVYEKLYRESPEIARHFTYEKNGKIYAHISMVKAYTRTWVVHHHAARIMESQLTGFRVFNQIVQYLNNISRLPSARTDYVLGYYRPENEFPDLVFGGFTRELGNLQGSSVDLFSYMTYPTNTAQVPLPDGWFLNKCTTFDLWELERSYQHQSGGLLLDAMGIKQGRMVDEYLEKQYRQLGFIRKCEAYSLTYQGDLVAVLIVEQSAPGINLSELINGIKILVTKAEMLIWDTLSQAISRLAGAFHYPEVPLLIYPAEYAQTQNIIPEKQYQLCIINLRDHDNDYAEYLARRFRLRFK